jgi:cobalamin biosynthesis protein CobT
LSLLQNFVIKQTPSTTLLNTLDRHAQIDLNNNCDDENSNQSMTNSSDEKSQSLNRTKSNESPLASLEKMLAYPKTTTTTTESFTHNTGPKKKKFDKYRLFAEKMLRSTLS